MSFKVSFDSHLLSSPPMSSLRQLPIRLQDLILQLRYPLPGISEVESYQLRELRRGGWLRDGPDELTSKEKNVLIEMQAGFEHAQEGEEEYWEAVWDRRRRIVMDREAAVVPPQHRVKMEQGEVDGGGAINSSRSASGSGRFDLKTARSTSTLSDGSRVEASQAQVSRPAQLPVFSRERLELIALPLLFLSSSSEILLSSFPRLLRRSCSSEKSLVDVSLFHRRAYYPFQHHLPRFLLVLSFLDGSWREESSSGLSERADHARRV